MQKWIILIVVCVIIILGGIIVLNCNIENEYIPETEIEDKELRKTMISLYFQDLESKEIVKESRLIDSKDLLKNPYEKLLDMLIKGPENQSFQRVIPENAKINEVKIENNVAIINFTEELIKDVNDDIQKKNIIESIVRTLTELTEINGIKILINGNEVDGFIECGLDFKEVFTRKKFE